MPNQRHAGNTWKDGPDYWAILKVSVARVVAVKVIFGQLMRRLLLALLLQAAYSRHKSGANISL